MDRLRDRQAQERLTVRKKMERQAEPDIQVEETMSYRLRTADLICIPSASGSDMNFDLQSHPHCRNLQMTVLLTHTPLQE